MLMLRVRPPHNLSLPLCRSSWRQLRLFNAAQQHARWIFSAEKLTAEHILQLFPDQQNLNVNENINSPGSRVSHLFAISI